MNDLRDEQTEAVMLLADLKEQQMKSHHPLMFSDAIKAMRRKTLGLYTQALNRRIPSIV